MMILSPGSAAIQSRLKLTTLCPTIILVKTVYVHTLRIWSSSFNHYLTHKPSFMDRLREFGLIYNPDDDSLTRPSRDSITTEAHNSVPNQTIFTQDIPLNSTHKTWLRLYTPITPPSDHTKLPLILYFHGGGFIICSPSDSDIHPVCTSMASDLPAVVLSLEYRLSPESRLPAAYEDAMEALHWVQIQARSEKANALMDMVDFSRCYLMGSSAGGNIVYHASLRALSLDLEPLVIRGCIFDHPFFGSVERSGSEWRLADDPYFPLASSDVMWELALPKGSNRDHEYCNPLVKGSYDDKIGMLRRCFLNTRGGDLLVDCQMKFVKMLEGKDVLVTTRYVEEGYHCMDIQLLGEHGKALFDALKQFLSDTGV